MAIKEEEKELASYDGAESLPAYVEARLTAYGQIYEQVEFITENGLEAWQQKVAEIKAEIPKE